MGSILRPYPSNLRRTATEPPNHHPGTSCWGLAINRPSRVHQLKPFRRERENVSRRVSPPRERFAQGRRRSSLRRFPENNERESCARDHRARFPSLTSSRDRARLPDRNIRLEVSDKSNSWVLFLPRFRCISPRRWPSVVFPITI